MYRTRPRIHRQHERGIALVTALLILVLASTLAVTFMITATGERSVSSNVHIARGSLYAADAGVRTSQQVLANMAKTKLDSLLAAWSGTGAIITAPTNLFPAGVMPLNGTSPSFATQTTITFDGSSIADSSQVYNYRYSITANGDFGAQGARAVRSEGLLRVSATRGNFSDYLIFTNTHLTPTGGSIWFNSNTSFDGRVHTNTQFRFAYQPTFQDLVSSVNQKAWYYNKGSNVELNANNNGTIDVPNFYGGFDRNQASVALPANNFNQQNAALGLDPSSSVPPSNSTINAAIGSGAGSGTPPNGIYMVAGAGSPPPVTGGLYVQGNLDQMLCKVDSLGRQVYVMRQGSTTKTVTLSPGTNQTFVYDGSVTTPYTGLPRGVIYTKGAISDLRGPDRISGTPPPGIASSNQLLIAATDDIVLQRDLVYQDYNNGQNILGVYSSGGDVRVGTSAPNDCNLDAFVMAAGVTDASFRVDNYNSGSPRGTFHLRGGMVSERYGAFHTFTSSGALNSGFARDFRYDRRGLVPPFFPTTSRYVADRPTARTLAWREL
jgi:Tfp pilus assembly protein PilX